MRTTARRRRRGSGRGAGVWRNRVRGRRSVGDRWERSRKGKALGGGASGGMGVRGGIGRNRGGARAAGASPGSLASATRGGIVSFVAFLTKGGVKGYVGEGGGSGIPPYPPLGVFTRGSQVPKVTRSSTRTTMTKAGPALCSKLLSGVVA